MGYRLSVEKVGDNTPKYYGTKLYGYVDDETKLLSYKWLIKEGFLKADEIYVWDYCCNNPILMRVEDFKIFVNFYNEDLNETLPEKDTDYFINDKDIQQFLALDDWELIVVSWV